MNQRGPFDFADYLHERGVAVVIIGGHAVNFHGFVRTTEDIDFVFNRDAHTEQQLYETLRDWEAFWISDEIDAVTGIEKIFPVTLEYIRSHRFLMLGTVAGYVDFFDFIPGFPDASLDDLFATAHVVGKHRFASLEWLKRMKRAAGRAQDQLDLENLP